MIDNTITILICKFDAQVGKLPTCEIKFDCGTPQKWGKVMEFFMADERFQEWNETGMKADLFAMGDWDLGDWVEETIENLLQK